MRRVVVALLLLATAACGSTVQTHSSTDTGAINQTATLGGTAPTAAAGSAAPDAGPNTAAGASATRTTSPRGSQGSPSKSSGGTAASIPPTGHGWDKSYVYVGVITQKDTQRVFATFGANNVDPGDTEAQANAVADDINAHGGMLGRKVKILIDDVSILTAAQNGSSVGEQICTHFTQDAPVIAVWNVSTQVDQVPTLRGCLAKAGIPLFTAAARAIDDKEMADLPYYFHTFMVSWSTLAPVFVGRLRAQGWLGGWNPVLGQPASSPAKVGILVDGSPEGARVAALLQSELAKAGSPGAVVYQYSDPSQGQASSVNYFNGHGVTHVIVTDVEMTAFQQSAESQRYHPRYGITTYNDPYSNLEASGLTPSGANNGAIGVGWAPALDVAQERDPGASPGAPACLDVMKRAAQQLNGKRLAQAYSFSLCDTLYLLGKGTTAAGGFSGRAIYDGIMRVGPGYAIANGFVPALTPAKRYVPGVVRDIAWDAACSCIRYGATTTPL